MLTWNLNESQIFNCLTPLMHLQFFSLVEKNSFFSYSFSSSFSSCILAQFTFFFRWTFFPFTFCPGFFFFFSFCCFYRILYVYFMCLSSQSVRKRLGERNEVEKNGTVKTSKGRESALQWPVFFIAFYSCTLKCNVIAFRCTQSQGTIHPLPWVEPLAKGKERKKGTITGFLSLSSSLSLFFSSHPQSLLICPMWVLA